MSITNERKIELIEFDIDLDDDLYKFLVKFGLEKIKEDKKELASYALNYILKEKIKSLNLNPPDKE